MHITVEMCLKEIIKTRNVYKKTAVRFILHSDNDRHS